MSIIYVMIPLALVLVALAVWALVWAIRSGQLDDLESHGWSVVLDDDTRPPPEPERREAGREAGTDAADRRGGTGAQGDPDP